MRSAEKRGLLLTFAVFGVYWGAWAAVLPAVQRHVGVDDGRLGLALGAIAVAAVPMMPVAGRLVDRFGARRALPACLVAFAVAVPLPALAGGLTALVVLLVLLGAATGALDVVANAAVASWERLESDHLMSSAHGAFSVGVLLGSAAAGLAREGGAGPRPVLLVVGLCVLGVVLAQPAYRSAVAGAGDRVGRRRLPAALVGIGLLTAAAFLFEDAVQSWSALHLERGLDASPAVSGLGPGLFAGAMAVGRLSGAALSRRVAEDVQLGVLGGFVTVGVLVTALAPSPLVALVGLVVAGLGVSVLAPVLYSAVGRRAAPGRQGADLAAVTALGYVGFVAGPPLVGALSAATSLPGALGCLGLLGAFLSLAGPVVLRGRAGAAAGSR